MKTRDRSKFLALALFVTLLAATVAGPAQAQADTTSFARVDVRYVTVGSHFFAPNTFAFQAGQPIRLVVTNVSQDHLHDVLIVRGASLILVGGYTAPIQENATITIDWTPLGPGTYRLLCAICGPDEMIAFVTVGI